MKYAMTLRIDAPAPTTVEETLMLPSSRLRRLYDQGEEGACVGFGWSWAMSIRNALQGRSGLQGGVVPVYDARWLYQNAQAVDEYADTPPEQGTSVRAGGDILRDVGHVRLYRGKVLSPNLADGIAANRWAQTVDEMRLAIALGLPVVIGVNWYRNFDRPQPFGREFFIGTDGKSRAGTDDLGPIRGGHCVCVYAASDKRQAFKVVNNWGMTYPLVWLPYSVMARLLAEYGEAALITDR